MARSSRQRGEMVCTVCQTKTSPLWRRGDKGEVLCNACGLYHKHHKKPRPISLANNSARSARRSNHQNNENKVQNQRYPNIFPNPNMMNSSMRPFTFPQAIAPALTPVNATGSTLKPGNNMSPTLQPAMFNNNNNNGNSNNGNGNSMYLPSLSPTFKMSPTMGSSTMPIPIKKNMMATSSVASPPLSNSLSPPANTPPNFKMNTSSNQNNNNSELMNPAPLIQKNNSEHYYNHDNLKPMDMDNKDDFMNSDNDTKYQSKVSIASMLNGDNAHRHHHHHNSNNNNNNNNYQNKYNNYNALPTPLSTSPSMDQNDNNYYGQNKEDIEAACLLISLRNCEKVC